METAKHIHATEVQSTGIWPTTVYDAQSNSPLTGSWIPIGGPNWSFMARYGVIPSFPRNPCDLHTPENLGMPTLMISNPTVWTT